jgi:hypothetical protein
MEQNEIDFLSKELAKVKMLFPNAWIGFNATTNKHQVYIFKKEGWLKPSLMITEVNLNQ